MQTYYSEIHRHDGESFWHHKHRQQRAEARRRALKVIPDVYKPRIWITGVDEDTGEQTTQDFGYWTHDTGYEAQYLKELKLVRAS